MKNITKRIVILMMCVISFTTLSGFAYASEETNYPYVEYILPENRGFKSYMDYEAITSTASKQYRMQKFAKTNYRGLRMIEDRYLIAVGTMFGASVGQLVTLTLENGSVIECIVGDIKADKDTDDMNLFTLRNGCCSEFIVETSALPYETRTSGDVSKMYTNWNSPVYSVDIHPLYFDIDENEKENN